MDLKRIGLSIVVGYLSWVVTTFVRVNYLGQSRGGVDEIITVIILCVIVYFTLLNPNYTKYFKK